MPYKRQNFRAMQDNYVPLCAEHLIAMEEGIIEAYTGIKRVVSNVDDEPLVDLRDLESGVYMLYGYFSPYKNSNSTMVVNNELVHVAHKSDGSHIMCISPLNSKLTFIEILVDDTTADGFTYSRHSYDMLAIDGLRDRVKVLEDANATLTDMAKGKAPAIPVDASGDVVNITDGAAMPVMSLVSHITARQRGKGDPTPDNVRQFFCWNTTTAIHTGGKNLLGGLAFAQVFADGIPNAVIDAANKTVSYRMADVVTNIAGDTVGRFVPFKGKPNTRYTIFLRAAEGNTANTANLKILYEDGSSASTTLTVSTTETMVYTTKANATFIGLTGSRSGGTTVFDCNLCGIMEGVLTVDDFVPYEGGFVTADLPETVYGGTLDWTTGLLTVTHDCIESYSGEEVPDGWISSTGELSEGAQVVYPLSVPRTVQITPQQLDTLRGVNNLWSSTGETAVTYAADTQLYIDAKIAALAAAQVNN